MPVALVLHGLPVLCGVDTHHAIVRFYPKAQPTLKTIKNTLISVCLALIVNP